MSWWITYLDIRLEEDVKICTETNIKRRKFAGILLKKVWRRLEKVEKV